MIGRIAAGLLAALVGAFPAGAFALAAAPTQLVPAERITALAGHIARALVTDPDRALVPAFNITDQTVPAGVVAIAPGAAQLNSGFVGIPIAIDIDGRLVRTLFAGFRITSYVRMAVATRDLAPGTIVEPADLDYARVPSSGRAMVEISAFVGRKVRTSVARGAVMYPELTVINEIVHAGLPALLFVRDGSVALAADVVARSSGGLGEYVTIFDPQTQRVLSGVVTGPNTVELTLPGANGQ